jgi:hypothetical protein
VGAEPSERVMALFKVGIAGYLVGAVAWSLFWLAIAQNYMGMWWGYWYLVGFLAVSLSFMMVGVGCFALGRLFSSWLAVVTGAANIVASVSFFPMGLYYLLRSPPWASFYYHLWYIVFIAYGSMIASLLLWALTASIITPSSFHRLRTATVVAMDMSAIIFLLSFQMLRYGPIGLTLLTQPYVLAQVLSAVLLHKIASDNQRKSHDPKQASA